MVKIIKVRQCFECPYCDTRFNQEKYRMVDKCFFVEDTPREILDRFTIPEWCPLQEDK